MGRQKKERAKEKFTTIYEEFSRDKIIYIVIYNISVRVQDFVFSELKVNKILLSQTGERVNNTSKKCFYNNPSVVNKQFFNAPVVEKPVIDKKQILYLHYIAVSFSIKYFMLNSIARRNMYVKSLQIAILRYIAQLACTKFTA